MIDRWHAWAIANHEDVVIRVRMHVDDTTGDIYLNTAHGELLEPELFDVLDDAADRGVTIYVEVPSEEVRSKVHGRVPAANVAVSDLPLDAFSTDDRGPGRLLMVDRETILLTARKEGLVPGDLDETGLWGSEIGHGLGAWLQPLLSARIESLEFATDEE